MKKNRMMRLASILLVCVLLSTSVISGTFAKYTSSATTNDSAKVAKWSVLVNDEDVAGTTEKSITIDLFNTVLDTKTGEKETDIEANDGTLIAPGTKGSFVIELTNSSEVNATYDLVFTVENEDEIPIEFTGLADADDAAIGMGETKSVTVEWVWAFEGDDVLDTTLGMEEAVIEVTADIVFTQVD